MISLKFWRYHTDFYKIVHMRELKQCICGEKYVSVCRSIKDTYAGMYEWEQTALKAKLRYYRDGNPFNPVSVMLSETVILLSTVTLIWNITSGAENTANAAVQKVINPNALKQFESLILMEIKSAGEFAYFVGLSLCIMLGVLVAQLILSDYQEKKKKLAYVYLSIIEGSIEGR